MEFVTFEIAKKLKDKGFKCQYPIAMYNEIGVFHALYTSADCNPHIKSVFGNREYYDYEDFDELDYICPTISQVLKWLREEKKIFVAVNIGYCYESDEIPFPANPKMEPILKGYYCGILELDNLNNEKSCFVYFEDYEEAALAGIEYVLDNLI